MTNTFFHNYIINPSVELTPAIRISPFNTENILMPRCNDENIAKRYLDSRFSNYIITAKGRDAIDVALSYYQLTKNDVVSIVTTSDNFYISSCVTKCIEKYCSWSRVISEKTKVIFVNHEFGYPCQKLQDLKKYGLPIIEDCAHSFMSVDEKSSIGKIGDFVIYSLPKFFPMQVGGLLVSNKKDVTKPHINHAAEKYVLNTLSSYIPILDSICSSRLNNYKYLERQLSSLGIQPYFPLKSNIYPGVFLFKWKTNIDYSLLKEFMQRNGIESSVFYGQNAFFIPVHHNLSQNHLDYMITLLNYFHNALC